MLFLHQQYLISLYGRVSSVLCSWSNRRLITARRPFYVRGCAVGCGLSGMIVILALGLHFKLEHENKKRDRLYGSVEVNTYVDVTQGGDKNTAFRYLT